MKLLAITALLFPIVLTNCPDQGDVIVGGSSGPPTSTIVEVDGTRYVVRILPANGDVPERYFVRVGNETVRCRAPTEEGCAQVIRNALSGGDGGGGMDY